MVPFNSKTVRNGTTFPDLLTASLTSRFCVIDPVLSRIAALNELPTLPKAKKDDAYVGSE